MQEFYKPFGIKYKGLKLLDVAQTNIALHFNEVAEFIDEALAGGGKIVIFSLGVARWLAVRQARVRISARHPMDMEVPPQGADSLPPSSTCSEDR